MLLTLWGRKNRFARRNRRPKPPPGSVASRMESLEDRVLLAADLFVQGSALGVTGNPLSNADVNNDGQPDVVALDAANSAIRILTNDGSANFTETATLPTVGGGVSLAVGDLNGDGSVDLYYGANTNGEDQVWFNNGDGTFTAGQSFSHGNEQHSPSMFDADNDG